MESLVLGLLLAFASPLLLWPIEQLLPFPFVLEEMVKAVSAVFIAQNPYPKIIWPIIAGILFTVSETVFYLFNFLKLGDFTDIPKRLLLTGLLHVGTTVLLYLGAKKNYLNLLLSFIIAATIHFLFNYLI